MKEHQYKGFILKRDGYRSTPWNVYNKFGTNCECYCKTLSEAKSTIDDGFLDDVREGTPTDRMIAKLKENKKI